MTETRISELASIISTNTAIVDSYLRDSGHPTPSFDVNAPVTISIPSEHADVERARRAAAIASIELSELLQGNKALLSPPVNGTSLQAIYRYGIASKVPLDSSISYGDLAVRCGGGLTELDLRRIVRYAISFHRVFCEPEAGYVAHTAASRHLADSAQAHDMCGVSFDECWQAMSRTVEAMEKYGDAEPSHTGHALWTGSEEPFFSWIGRNGDKARRFAGAMGSLAPTGAALAHLRTSFDWAGLDDGATVVDVGGSTGHVSLLLAEAFPRLRFVVQDLPEVVAAAKAAGGAVVGEDGAVTSTEDGDTSASASASSSSASARITFQAHDFFTPQPTPADVYFFRAVFHDWPDAYCVRILRALVPALRPGNRLVIVDSLLPGPGEVDLLEERNNRAFDMLMLALFNSREREHADWAALLAAASPHFALVSAIRPATGMFGTIVVRWDGPRNESGGMSLD